MSIFRKIGDTARFTTEAAKGWVNDASDTLKEVRRDALEAGSNLVNVKDRVYASEIESIENWLRDQVDADAEQWLRDQFGDHVAHLIRSYIYDTAQIDDSVKLITAFLGRGKDWLYDQLDQFGRAIGLISIDTTWQNDLQLNNSYGITIAPDTFTPFDLNLGKILPNYGYTNSSIVSGESWLHSFNVNLHSLFNAKKFNISLPIEYSLSTGDVSIDYGLADILATWSYTFSPEPGFEVITGFATDRTNDTAKIAVDERVDYFLKAGLKFNWDINALLDVHYKYTGSSGGKIDLIGALGGAQRTGPHNSYSIAGDYYLELFNFSSDETGNDLKVAFFDLLDLAGFKDGTMQIDAADFFKVNIDLNNLKLFGDGFTSSLVNSDTLFPKVQAEHIPSNPAFDFILDIDDLLAEIPKVGQFFGMLDNEKKIEVSLGFIGDIEASIGYSILSADMKLGLSPATKVTFIPTDLKVELTPSWDATLAQEGSVGDTFFFAAPEEVSGELWLDADYALQGDLAFHLGVSLDPRLDVTVMMFKAGLDVETIIVDYSKEFKLGPLYSNTFLEEYSLEFYPNFMSYEIPMILMLADEDGYQFNLDLPSLSWDVIAMAA